MLQRDAEYARFLKVSVLFVLGELHQKPDYVETFIFSRSRRADLERLCNYLRIRKKVKKSKLVELFCSLSPSDRRKFLEENPMAITIAEEDCKTLKISAPEKVGTIRKVCRGIEKKYELFKITDVRFCAEENCV